MRKSNENRSVDLKEIKYLINICGRKLPDNELEIGKTYLGDYMQIKSCYLGNSESKIRKRKTPMTI